MANFMIGETGEGLSWYHLPLNRAIKLVQWGGDAGGNQLEVATTEDVPSVDIVTLGDKMKAASTAFTVRGRAAKTFFSLVGYVKGSGQTQKYTGDLKMWVGGAVTNQPGYDVDLLADAARNGNAQRVHMYSKFLFGEQDHTNPLAQNMTPGKWNCGTAARLAGPKLFGGQVESSGGPQSGRWDKSGHGGKMENLRFDPKRMATSVGKIRALLRKGTPVRLWMIHHDGFADPIKLDWRTHYLTVIGCSANRFLVFDPWATGSILKYSGGMYADGNSSFLGELEFNPTRPELGLRSPVDSLGYHYYVAIAGP